MQSLRISADFATTPDVIYAAWLSPEGHTAMTGAKAEGTSKVGGKFLAWDGYITARTLDLHPNWRIVQAWRTPDFADGDPDSRLAVEVNAIPGGTRVIIDQTRITSGVENYEKGWEEYYFKPMRAYFGAL